MSDTEKVLQIILGAGEKNQMKQKELTAAV